MPNKGYLILDHPADIGIESHGSTLAEAFEETATAMMSVIMELSGISAVDERKIEIHATDVEQLLVKWLNEILYLYDGQQFVPRKFMIKEITSTMVKATVKGEPLSAEKHQTLLDVKAVTYHQLYVNQTEGEVRVQVFLDI